MADLSDLGLDILAIPESNDWGMARALLAVAAQAQH